MEFYYAYKLTESGQYVQIDVIDASDINEWLRTEALIYDKLKLVKNTGLYTTIIPFEETWDVVDRGVEPDMQLHEKRSFSKYSKRSGDKRNKTLLKDRPKDQTSHSLKAARGENRKTQSYVPMYKQMEPHGKLQTAENVLSNAKKASSGAWKLSKRQIMEIAGKYKFNIPNEKKSSKHLGSTGILMWRKSPREYYLVKFSKHHKKR